jgi:hypothetical protein
VASRVSAAAELGQQAGLADPGRPNDLDRARLTLGQGVERLVEEAELGGSSDEGAGDGHLRRGQDTGGWVRVRVRSQGRGPMSGRRRACSLAAMPQFLLHHRHAPDECGVAFASFRGDPSPLRRAEAACSCVVGGHEVWWFVEADSADEALAQLPHYVARRATAIPIRKVQIP